MLDFHMEREHKKKQDGALEITRDGLLARYDRLNQREESVERKVPEAPAKKTKEEFKFDDDPKKYQCADCGMTFVSERAMNIHSTTMHEKTEKDHKCVVCAKEYTSKQALDTHMKVFHGDYDPASKLKPKDRCFQESLVTVRTRRSSNRATFCFKSS